MEQEKWGSYRTCPLSFQEDIAKAMGTSTSVIGRSETGGGSKHHSPTIATLLKYADALGYQLQLKLTKRKA